MTGDFSPDGESIEALAFSGSLRADSLLLDEEITCDWIEKNLGTTCGPCASDLEAQCAFLEFDDFAAAVTNLELAPQGLGDELDCVQDDSGLLSCSASSRAAFPSGVLSLLLVALGIALRRRP